MSLLVEGNGRELEEIEDESIDAIITDHPWLDKKAHKSGNQKTLLSTTHSNTLKKTLTQKQEC